MRGFRIGLVACFLAFGAWAVPGTATKRTSATGKPGPPATEVSLLPTPLRLAVDQRVWKERDLGSARNPGVVAMRAFSRDKASAAAECPAAMVVVAEQVPPDLGVVEFSAAKRSGMPPGVMERVFSHLDGTLQLKNAVGYRFRGTEGCHPVVHLVHAREAADGFTIVIEVDPRDYALIESEVLAMLKSLRFAGAAG